MSNTLNLAMDLVSRASITPNDQACQTLIAERLEKIGFVIKLLPFGEVDNLWAVRGENAPLFVFAGHTDVVPPGNENQWQFPPFTPTIEQNTLFGRGIADMKGGIAAMVTACERFVVKHPQHKGQIAFLLTSDEEGVATDGTIKVIEHLQTEGIKIDWCLLGEPASSEKLCDEIKNGRRGSLSGRLIIRGVQGHVAYPHLADNPIHRFAPVLTQFCEIELDQGNDFFPPTSFQITYIKSGNGAENVTPAHLELAFNFRYSTETTHLNLQNQLEAILIENKLKYSLQWQHSGMPFLTTPDILVNAAQQAVAKVCGYQPELSTSGGTSDGRFIAPTGAQVIEVGLINKTIHKVNECANIKDLDNLSLVYEKILENLLSL